MKWATVVMATQWVGSDWAVVMEENGTETHMVSSLLITEEDPKEAEQPSNI